MVSVWWYAIKGTFSREKNVGDFPEQNKDKKKYPVFY